jgi:hypothetical protein
MRAFIRATMASATLVTWGTAAAQGVATQRILSLSAAKVIAETALAACAMRGFHTSVVVVDRSGNMLAVLRDELAHPVTVEMARGKAYTAVVFRSSTLEFQKATNDDPQRAPQRDVPADHLRGRDSGCGRELGLESDQRRRVCESGRGEGRESAASAVARSGGRRAIRHRLREQPFELGNARAAVRTRSQCLADLFDRHETVAANRAQ